MQKLQYEHIAGSGLISELSKRVYHSPMEAFREVISNSIDEGSRKIHVRLSAEQIIFTDYGSGIKDIKKFVIYGESVKIANGKKDEIIGEKGLGKLSLLMLNEDRVVFVTNNGELGMHIVMDEKQFNVHISDADRYLKHRGTRITVDKPLFVPTQLELVKYLSKIFGLWIKKGIEIYVNDEKVEPFKHIDVEERKLFRNVTGNIKEDLKGNGLIDLYIKHVYVTTIMVDPNYLYSGWINSTKLTPTTSRDDVVKDEEYRKVMGNLKDFVKRFSEKQPKDFTNEEKMLAMQISKMAELFMEENKLKAAGSSGGRKSKKAEMIEVSVGEDKILVKKQDEDEEQNESEEKPDKERNDEEAEEEPQKLRDKPIQHLSKNKYGVITIIQEYGDEKPPIFFYHPNVIVINKTNRLYKFMTKAKSNYGPQYFRILPWLSRAFADLEGYIKGTYKNLSSEEMIQKRDDEIDKYIKWHLSEYKVI